MKKRTFAKALALFLILAMIIPCVPVFAADGEEEVNYVVQDYPLEEGAVDAWIQKVEGDGTAWTYEIGNATDLACFMQLGLFKADTSQNVPRPNNAFCRFFDRNIKLTDNIVWNAGIFVDGNFVPNAPDEHPKDDNGKYIVYRWEPYGKNLTNAGTYYGFRGNFNGNSKKISGLYIEETANNVGFFGYVAQGAIIRNITFENAYVKGTGKNIGVLVGSNTCTSANTTVSIENVTMKNCSVMGTGENVSGMVAYTKGNTLTIKKATMDDCSVVGSSNVIAGVVAYSESILDISDCVIDCNVTADGGSTAAELGQNVSGVVATSKLAMTVKNVDITCDIAGTGNIGALVDTCVGELVVENVNMDCSINAKGSVGYVSAIVKQPSAKTDISNVDVNCNLNVDQTCVGGVIAFSADNEFEIKIENCTVEGDIISTGSRVGSFIGASRNKNTVTMTNCVSYANVKGYNRVGGLIGGLACEGTLDECAFFGTISQTASSGTHTAGLVVMAYGSANGPVEADDLITVSFNNCYYLPGSTGTTGHYGALVHYGEAGYKILVDGKTNNPDGFINGAKQDNGYAYTNYSWANNFIQNDFKNASLSISKGSTDVLKIEGIQMGVPTDGAIDARFVASVKFNDTLDETTIKEIGFEVASVGKFASGEVTQKACASVYKEISTDFGEGTLKAEDFNEGADYIGTLVLTGMPTSSVATLVIRSYCVDADGVTHYSNYGVYTISDGVATMNKTIA